MKSISALKSNMKHGTSRQRGFAALEFGLVLLVVAILIVAAVMFYRSNLRKTSVNNNVAQILATAGAARSNYGQQNQYANLTTAIAVQGNLIPADLRDGAAATATNSFGGAIVVAPATLTGATPDAVQLTWPSVTADQCSDIVMGIQAEGRRVAVAGTDVKPTDGAVNIATVTTQCDSAANVTIDLYVGKS